QQPFLAGMSVFLMPWAPNALSSDPGSPLTDQEYEVFFSTLRPTWKASLVCLIRRSKGCQDPKIIQLDQYENHGEIPDVLLEGHSKSTVRHWAQCELKNSSRGKLEQ
uniref:Acrosin-binding protein n=1 Tax=Salvator merianae TaxID=96440 RepID=A0A8D0E147_SALMN